MVVREFLADNQLLATTPHFAPTLDSSKDVLQLRRSFFLSLYCHPYASGDILSAIGSERSYRFQ